MFVLRDHQLGRCMLKSAGTIDICFYLSDEIGNDCFSGQTIKLSIRFLSLLFFFIFFVFEKFLVSYFYLIAIKFVRLRTLNRLNTSDDSSIVFHSFIHVFFLLLILRSFSHSAAIATTKNRVVRRKRSICKCVLIFTSDECSSRKNERIESIKRRKKEMSE